MKKILFVIAVIALSSCGKDELPNEKDIIKCAGCNKDKPKVDTTINVKNYGN